MIGAALYLSRRSLANATRRRLRRLREPKYLIGSLVGLLYFWWILFRPRGTRATPTFATGLVEQIVPLGALVLAVVLVLAWTAGSSETPFPFSLAETQFLFTAPLTRRQVIAFKVLRSQTSLLFSAVLSVLLFSGFHFTAARFMRVGGLWLVYATLQLNFAAAAFVRANLTEHGLTGWRRRAGLVLGFAALVGAGWWGVRHALPGIADAFSDDPAEGAAALGRALGGGVLGVLLWPLRALLGPLFATTPRAFLAALPGAVLVLAVHYLWVVSSALAFEEVAAEAAEKTARRIDALRRGRGLETPLPSRVRRPALLRLAATGSPARAILWKNLTGLARTNRPRTLVFLAIFAVAIAGSLGSHAFTPLDWIATFAVIFGGYALVFGPFIVRFDLRRDLELADLLKTAPVRGRDVVAGEVLAPITAVTAFVWTFALIAFAATVPRVTGLPPLGERSALLVAALAVVPAFSGLLITYQNAVVLLFPAWAAIGPDRATGVEAIGQRILVMVGGWLALLVGMLPGVVIAAVVAGLLQALGMPLVYGAAVGAVGGAATVGLTIALVVTWLGRVFERLDPAAAGLS
jgi:hypothetical protein